MISLVSEGAQVRADWRVTKIKVNLLMGEQTFNIYQYLITERLTYVTTI